MIEIRSILLACLGMFFSSNVCLAEIPCVCPQELCTCFSQLGDEGQEIEYISHTLIEQGYLSQADDASICDEKAQKAILYFQETKILPVTGTVNDETLSLPPLEILPEELDRELPFSNGRAVWIPADGDIRRHVKFTCFSMLDPRLVSVRNAERMNMQPCGRCNKNGKNE